MGQESAIQSDVVAYARSYGIIAKKMDKGEGWPDYMFIGRGRVLFIEFKAPGERPSPAQVTMKHILEDNGITVFVVDNAEKGKDIIFIFFRLVDPWTKSSLTTGDISPK